MKILTADQLFGLMNEWGKQTKPFVFLIDAFASKGIVEEKDQSGNHILYKTHLHSNAPNVVHLSKLNMWDIHPVSFHSYYGGFNRVITHIQRGDSFLLNYTQPTRVETNLTLEELFYTSQARYKVHLKGVFTCFSPETFVTISNEGIIASYPMKGTAGVATHSAEQ
ncbi:MAG: chorismate-binding protein, partial [Verrucomicrobiota bacterium]|nr:chorismate-binding protein [Verrucomicrobiota bacterium]